MTKILTVKNATEKRHLGTLVFFFSMARQPLVGQGLLIVGGFTITLWTPLDE
jgi:hypothetical protein